MGTFAKALFREHLKRESPESALLEVASLTKTLARPYRVGLPLQGKPERGYHLGACPQGFLGKLEMPEGFVETVEEEGFTHLPVTPVHAMAVRALPWHHRDPFDRLLVAQAAVEDLRLLTAEPLLARYGKHVWVV